MLHHYRTNGIDRRNKPTRRARLPQRTAPTFEAMEPRVMLSVTSGFDTGTGLLTADSNAADAIAVTVIAGNVKVNGQDPGGVVTAASAVLSIRVTGGPGANEINLAAVTSADFTSLIGQQVELNGGVGNDTITGSALGDLIRGGAGNDGLIGGDSNDLFEWNEGDGDDTIDGGGGADTVAVVGGGANDNFTISASGTRVILARTGVSPFSLSIGTVETLFLNAGSGNDTVTFGSLVGVADLQSVLVSGGDGTDALNASGITNAVINVVMDGQGGNDTLTGGAGNDDYAGGGGDDLLLGGLGNDILIGDAGRDTLQGQDGNDTLIGLAGNDQLEGAGGDDVLRGGADNDTLDGGTGNDFADFSDSVSAVNAHLFKGKASGEGNDFLANFEGLIGSVFNDKLFGDPQSNTIIGGLGNDRIIDKGGNNLLMGGDGDDFIKTGAGNNVILGGDGADIIKAGFGSNSISGGAGNDILKGGKGNDSILGDDGNDIIKGKAGNDTLEGGAGADTMNGGPGTDTLIADPSDSTSNGEVFP